MWLGEIRLQQQEYAKANELFQQCLAIYRQISDRGGMATSLRGLGNAALSGSDYRTATQHFREALQIAFDLCFRPLALSLLIGVGELLLQTGDRERGLELLALAQTHPASEEEAREQAQRFLEHYRLRRPEELYSSAMQRGKQLDLEETTQAVLSILDSVIARLDTTSADDTGRASQPAEHLLEPLTGREQIERLPEDGDAIDPLLHLLRTISLPT